MTQKNLKKYKRNKRTKMKWERGLIERKKKINAFDEGKFMDLQVG